MVRADFDLVLKDDREHILRWAQRVKGTPFERVLRSAETEVRLTRRPESDVRWGRRGRHRGDDRASPGARAAVFARSGGDGPPRGRGTRSTKRSTGSSGSVAERARRPRRCAGGGGATPSTRRRSAPSPRLPARDGGPRRPSRAAGGARQRPRRRPASTRGALDRLRAILGTEAVRGDHHARVLHAAGKGYPDLVRLRAGAPEGAPDAVLYPRSHAQVMALLALASRVRWRSCRRGRYQRGRGGGAAAGPPRGGCGARHGPNGGFLGLDRCRGRSPSRAGAGPPSWRSWFGAPRADARAFPAVLRVRLARWLRGYPLGPAGLHRLRPIERMVLGLRMAAPPARSSWKPFPASAAGPGLRELVVGSEGALGVINRGVVARAHRARRTDLRRRVLREPRGRRRRPFATLTRRLAAGCGAPLRRARDAYVAGARRAGGVKGGLGRAYLGVRGVWRGVSDDFGLRGRPEEVGARRWARARAAARGTAGSAWGARRGQPGCSGAQRRPICATSC